MGGSATPAKPPRTRLDPAERRSQIRAAAAKRFRRDGYEAVSMDDVAGDAGVARALVNHYFGSKRDLFLDVVRHEVRVPKSVRIVPDTASGDLEAVLAVCVEWWLDLAEAAGGLWPAGSEPSGFVDADLDSALRTARDDLVERMLEEVPFPDVDRDLLRSTLRCFAAFARVATDEWLRTEELSRDATAVLLRTSLADLVQRSVPAMAAEEDR